MQPAHNPGGGSRRRGWRALACVALALAAAALIARQRLALAALRVELGAARSEQEPIRRMQDEIAALAPMQVSDDELTRLRNDHAALSRLRAEVEALKKRTAGLKPQARPSEPVRTKPRAEPSITEDLMPANTWKNAGRATPVATMETVLWAAAGGDVDTLASLLVLDSPAKEKAERMLAGLPATEGRPRSGEALIAMLTAKDVPLGSAKIAGLKADPADAKRMRVVVMLLPPESPDRKSKLSQFSLHADAGGWKIAVPAAVVDRYAAMLKGGAAAGPKAN